MYIIDAITAIIDMASSHQGVGYSKGLVNLLMPRYNKHMRQTRYSIFSICSWWGFATSTMWLLHGTLHSSIQSFFSILPIWYMMIFDSFGMYLGTIQHTGGGAPVLIANFYPRIVRSMPFLQEQPQYFLILLMILYIDSADAISPILRHLVNLYQSYA